MTTKELRDMNDDQLVVEAGKISDEIFNLRFQHATGELENTARIGFVKRDLARALTVARERGLKIETVKVVD